MEEGAGSQEEDEVARVEVLEWPVEGVEFQGVVEDFRQTLVGSQGGGEEC